MTTTVTRDAGDVVVTVQDECGGIPADVIGRVFETGYRGTAARSPGDGRGSGLGLAIVAGVAAAHGGSAEVANAERRVPVRAAPARRGALQAVSPNFGVAVGAVVAVRAPRRTVGSSSGIPLPSAKRKRPASRGDSCGGGGGI